MAFVCIPKSQADAFKRALKDRDIKIEDLIHMSTEARTKVFESFAGSQAKAMNTLFEEKLVLKNRVLGLKNFIAKVAQEGRYDPARKAELEKLASEFRQKQQERIFSPKEEEVFLNDLADATVGTHITEKEANNIFEFSQKAEEAKVAMDAKPRSGFGEPPTPEERTYGAEKHAYESYVEALSKGDQSLKTLVREAVESFKETYKENKPKAVLDLLRKAAQGAMDTSVSTVASLDNSFLGRQGLGTLLTEPQRFIQAKRAGIPYKSIWADAAGKSFVDFYKTLRGFDQKAVQWGEIYGQKNYSNGAYEDARVLPKNEEAYPTSLPERVPVVGRVFKGSQAAFEGSALRMRTQTYDFLSELAERNGADMTDKYQRKSLGTVVNSATARGQWGEKGEPAAVRLLLWAPKMLKANIDVLTAHTGQDISAFARRQAQANLVSILATTAAFMATMNALNPGSIETDPTSSDFGKYRWKDEKGIKHTVDFTGGKGSLVVLAARLLEGRVKSSVTGVTQKLNSGEFGSKTYLDVLIDFLAGKTNPIAGSAISLARGADFKGDAPTAEGIAGNITLPIAIQNLIESKDDPTISKLAEMTVDALGFGGTTYLPKKSDWNKNPGVELQAFKEKVGDAQFKEANNLYDKQLSDFMSSLQENEKYQALSDEDKQKVLDKKKEDLKGDIFRQYSFRYRKSPPVRTPTI